MKIPKEINDKLKWKTEQYGEPLQFPYVEAVDVVQICEDCGKCVTNRNIQIRKMKKTHHNPSYWRRQCGNCKLIQHPLTGEYTVEHYSEIAAIFNQEIKETDK